MQNTKYVIHHIYSIYNQMSIPEIVALLLLKLLTILPPENYAYWS